MAVKQLPIDEVTRRIAAKVRIDSSGAKSLAHVLVVVPTAQSGRRLRLRLVELLGAFVPPTIRMPMQLLKDDDRNVAGRTAEIVAFYEALGEDANIEVATQLSDIRGITSANALSFEDVASRIGDILTSETAGFEVERWERLAELEKRYIAALEKKGLVDRIVAMKSIVENPKHLEGIEEIVLAYVLDPSPIVRTVIDQLVKRDGLKLEEIGSNTGDEERIKVPDECIMPCATAGQMASKIAAIFAKVNPKDALPALCVADAEEFPEIQGTMKAKGIKVCNPSTIPLVASSLGHLVEQVVALVRTRSYNVFSSFIRGGDVRRWLCEELKLESDQFVAALTQLDELQAKLLPEKMGDIGPKSSGDLKAIFESVENVLKENDIRKVLVKVFAGLVLDERDSDAREFAAAAEVVNDLIEECSNSGLAIGPQMELFAKRMREATYSLEIDDGDVVLTDGWLELPFLDADELVITGFNEGCVPEAVVGHAFLPDSLRRGLGLLDNESRTRRDRAILSLVLGSRDNSKVKIFFKSVDAKGEIIKPSRLLFDGTNDRELAERVKKYYKINAGTDASRLPDMPNEWKLHLPIPPEKEELLKTSPSKLDDYLKCPFTYYLKKIYGEKLDDRAEELDAAEFGSLVHNALQAWAQGPYRDSVCAKDIADDLAMRVECILGERFGTAVPAIVALQAESVKQRLESFAKIQVAWRQEGWRIVAAEKWLSVVYNHTRVNGRCDRIDYNEKSGKWCVIDYKTYDSLERAKFKDKKTGDFTSLQLPLYCAMLDTDKEYPEAKRDNIISAYCVLGKSEENTAFSESMDGTLLPDAEKQINELIDKMERGIFWPPAATKEWQWDFNSWIYNTPDESVDEAWIEDQIRRCPKEESDDIG